MNVNILLGVKHLLQTTWASVRFLVFQKWQLRLQSCPPEPGSRLAMGGALVQVDDSKRDEIF